jgi:hypothetical protein
VKRIVAPELGTPETLSTALNQMKRPAAIGVPLKFDVIVLDPALDVQNCALGAAWLAPAETASRTTAIKPAVAARGTINRIFTAASCWRRYFCWTSVPLPSTPLRATPDMTAPLDSGVWPVGNPMLTAGTSNPVPRRFQGVFRVSSPPQLGFGASWRSPMPPAFRRSADAAEDEGEPQRTYRRWGWVMFEGIDAARVFLENWVDPYEEFDVEPEVRTQPSP